MVNHQKRDWYTITELEDITGLSRRTIHYYTKEEVIPPPSGKGGGALYTYEHLLRLLLIPKMKRTHLKLSGIREALDSMSSIEMETLLESGTENYQWDTPSLRTWMEGDEEQRNQIRDTRPYSVRDYAQRRRMDRDSGDVLYSARRPEGGMPLKRDADVTDTSWRRFNISDGVEVNLRSDILKRNRVAVKRWLQQLMEVLDSG